MNKGQALAFAKLICEKVPNDQSRAGWVIATCPLGPWTHENGSKSPHFAIKIEHGDSFCNCFVCGQASGPASSILVTLAALKRKKDLREVNIDAALQLIAQAEEGLDLPDPNAPSMEDLYYTEELGLHEFPDWWLATFPPWRDADFTRDYLAMRGVPPAIADALDLRADTVRRRVCIPVRDREGILRGLHGRLVEEEPGVKTVQKYRMYPQAHRTNPDVWLGEHWLDTTKPVVIVEGYFDLISVMRVYRNVVSPLFPGANGPKIKRMSDAYHLVTLYDPDTAGESGRNRIDKWLPDHIRTHLKTPAKRDPGDLSVEEISAILAPHVTLDEVIDW